MRDRVGGNRGSDRDSLRSWKSWKVVKNAGTEVKDEWKDPHGKGLLEVSANCEFFELLEDQSRIAGQDLDGVARPVEERSATMLCKREGVSAGPELLHQTSRQGRYRNLVVVEMLRPSQNA
jgi:hypothetical protein